MRKKYDTSVIFLYAIGKEKFLPEEFRKQIPYTTISSWRKTDYSKYIGHEFRYFFDEAFDKIEINYRYRRAKKLLQSVGRAWTQVSAFFPPLFKQAAHNKFMQARIVKSIQVLQNEIGMRRALRIFGLSRTKYQQWILELKFDCFDSFSSVCAKRHPHQLELNEVKKMKKLLTEHDHDHWPIVSIASLAFRKEDITASLYSWYKYARLMNISKKPLKKQLKTVGIVSKYPNEYLHVDTTYYPLIDGKNICITFVMDNFSKMILGYHVDVGMRFDNVKKAMIHALKIIEKHPDACHSFLVADGGKENHNKKINEFISNLSGRKITKIRALKDIRFSNSPVEAVHRTMKSRYLRRNKFATVKALKKFLKWAVEDYNTLRPHYKHRPRTPHEVYFNIPLNFDIRTRMKEGMKRRVANNKMVKCIQCKAYRERKDCAINCEFH